MIKTLLLSDFRLCEVDKQSGYPCLLLSFWESHSWAPQCNGAWLSTEVMLTDAFRWHFYLPPMLLHTLAAL